MLTVCAILITAVTVKVECEVNVERAWLDTVRTEVVVVVPILRREEQYGEAIGASLKKLTISLTALQSAGVAATAY